MTYTIQNGLIAPKRDYSNASYALQTLASRVRPMVYMTDLELMELTAGSVFTFDVECYPNWFFIAFREVGGLQRVVTFERSEYENFDQSKLGFMLNKFGIVGFNSKNYDTYMTVAALNGMSYIDLKTLSDDIIVNDLRGFELERKYRLNMPMMNHVDLIEVAPLSASLKAYGARLHFATLQDLPFDPTRPLTYDEIVVGRKYCGNDLGITECMLLNLKDQLQLRAEMSRQYGLDLRSKSDAQIAEAVICKEFERLSGTYPERPKLAADYTFKYRMLDYLDYKTPIMQRVKRMVEEAVFGLDMGGSPQLPDSLNILIPLGHSTYKLGIGGLHSTEKSQAIVCKKGWRLKDIDVASFYPEMIRNQRLSPEHLEAILMGAFLQVYSSIVDRRLEAKRNKNKVVADSLKITINGSFGKFGSKWSALYSPDLMTQVTISGQLNLLLLIETFELAGISVVSANTDGIVIYYPEERDNDVDGIVKGWEQTTNLKMEDTQYMALLSRDVNNYIAVKRKQDKETKEWLFEPDGCKVKGCFSNPWDDADGQIFRFHKNPETTICTIAVQEFITKGTPLAKTIVECKDMRKFIAARNVKGGAVYCANGHNQIAIGNEDEDESTAVLDPNVPPPVLQDGELVGKVVRWYYAKGSRATINYAISGNKVPKSDGATPYMDAYVGFPSDIDYQWYIREARDMLFDIGYFKRKQTTSLFAQDTFCAELQNPVNKTVSMM